jgi:DNA-binding transcriptional regulator YhcF (GntR family)
VAAAVRAQVADGTLRPGQPAPSGAALSRVTGYSTLTCRRALRALVGDGVLVAGPSRNARPRVAGGARPRAERDLAATARALSAGLAARRRAAGLTQPELARHAVVSVTTVGHAETGRLWQSRRFWDRVDAVLGAHGDLLRLHDAYREAAAASIAKAGPAGQADGAGGGGDVTGTASLTGRGGIAGPAAALARAMPASVTIVWSNGAVTTVHPPEAS